MATVLGHLFRCAICDAKCSAGGVVACQRCKSARFCSKACEDAAGERGHSERCAVICRLPAASEQQKKLILSDYVLDEDTMELFRANNWLGDENIEFFWEQIAKELNPNSVVSDILFVPPTVIMLAHMMSAEQLRDDGGFARNLGDLTAKQMVIMAINDSQMGQTGGTHWGCLIYARPCNEFRYYDSIRGACRIQAKAFAEKFSLALGAQGAAFVEESDAPQQANSSDCGVYTMVVGEILARTFNATGTVPTSQELAHKMHRNSRVQETRSLSFSEASAHRARANQS
jgi:hypothetical protein